MGQYFEHAKVFPIIADIITKNGEEFISHQQIAAALQEHPTGRSLVDEACAAARQKNHRHKGRNWWASNMVQWFSQKFTQRRNDYQKEFDREEIGGSYSYRLHHKKKSGGNIFRGSYPADHPVYRDGIATIALIRGEEKEEKEENDQ